MLYYHNSYLHVILIKFGLQCEFLSYCAKVCFSAIEILDILPKFTKTSLNIKFITIKFGKFLPIYKTEARRTGSKDRTISSKMFSLREQLQKTGFYTHVLVKLAKIYRVAHRQMAVCFTKAYFSAIRKEFALQTKFY